MSSSSSRVPFASFLHMGFSMPPSDIGKAMWDNYSLQAVNCKDPVTTADCKHYMTAEKEADYTIRNHYLSLGNPVTCCKSACGQVENMSTCAIVYKDNNNSNNDGCKVGGSLVCTRASEKYCKEPNAPLVATYTRFPTVFQPQRNTESKDGNPGSSTPTPWQTCLYNSADFTKLTDDQMDAVMTDTSDMPKKGNPNYDEVMMLWCSHPATDPKTCPSDAMTGIPSSTCSRYHSTSPEGIRCKAWITGMSDTLRSQGYIDSMGSLYCSAHPTASECACMNRGMVEAYRSNKQYFAYNDGCWYNPCTPTYSSNYFQPSDVVTTFRASGPPPTPNTFCPTNFCATYLSAGGNITLTGNTEYVNCDMKSK